MLDLVPEEWRVLVSETYHMPWSGAEGVRFPPARCESGNAGSKGLNLAESWP
jgi:hypothetical protein